MEHGERPFEAALNGSKEIGFTIVSMTVSLAAVFIPVLFMSGILGRLFREFAVTITSAILISGVVSVTLTPMLCSRFLRASALHTKTRVARVMERLFTALFHGYERSLAVVLRHRGLVGGVFVAVLAATLWMFVIVPIVFRVDRRRLRRDEYGALQRPAEAAAHAAAHRGADRPADAAADPALSRLSHLRHPPAGAADRRPHDEQRVQHHGPDRRHRRAVRMG